MARQVLVALRLYMGSIITQTHCKIDLSVDDMVHGNVRGIIYGRFVTQSLQQAKNV